MRSTAIKRAYGANCLYATAERSWEQTLRAARAVLADDELWLVRWALIGQTTGHEWCACSVCDELRLMSPPTVKSDAVRCKMTLDCKGVMVRIAPRPFTSLAVKRSLGMIE
jgi:hypothetical protein